ncbi:MAG: hypothetical protein LBN74_00620 [Prevotella sp.]|jgi:tetratricopeptide (TPR) repeat protein|nr:hypothetical protein [Prevotella sp.]
MKGLLIIGCICLFSCSGSKSQSLSNEVPCQEGINLLPMYGKVEKCPLQLKADSAFLAYCDQQFQSRTEAFDFHRETGWRYMNEGDLDTAMKRFNQAWLLDKDNPSVYCCFGWLLGKKNKNEEAVLFFEKAVSMKPADVEILKFAGLGYNELYKRSKNATYHKKALELLNKGLILSPENTSIKGVIKEISE